MTITTLLLLTLISCGKNAVDVKKDPPVVEDVKFLEGNDSDPDIGDLSAPGTFFDKFEQNTLNESVWQKEHRVWGQPANPAHQHGGVIKENVYMKEGNVVMRALGDRYTGNLRGVNNAAKRIGGVISSKERFASGRYEVKARILQKPDMGVLSAAWTFWYKEITNESHPNEFQRALAAGNVSQNGKIVLNQEIDIEVIGKDLAAPLFSNWIGERDEEHETKTHKLTAGLNDGKYHIFRWDWHTGSETEPARVDYYIDNVLLHSSTEKVPYIASHFYIGNWFAWWAGNESGTYKRPDFDQAEMYVDWVKFVPFNQPNDSFLE